MLLQKRGLGLGLDSFEAQARSAPLFHFFTTGLFHADQLSYAADAGAAGLGLTGGAGLGAITAPEAARSTLPAGLEAQTCTP